MTTWTDELKKQVVDSYLAQNPTAENSAEIVKEIADEVSQSANGVRQVLVQAKVYVKKEAGSGTPATKTATKTGTKTGDGETKRVSKDSQIATLREAIEAAGKEVDEDIIGKLTGKAAAYFASVLAK